MKHLSILVMISILLLLIASQSNANAKGEHKKDKLFWTHWAQQHVKGKHK